LFHRPDQTLSETVVDGSPTKESAEYPAGGRTGPPAGGGRTGPPASGRTGPVKCGPMSLLNALAACVMSARLRAEYRQWSLQQLVSGLSALGRGVSSAVGCVVDTAGDLPPCSTAKLEAHQNRVTSCMFHQRKALLATRFDINISSVLNLSSYGTPWLPLPLAGHRLLRIGMLHFQAIQSISHSWHKSLQHQLTSSLTINIH